MLADFTREWVPMRSQYAKDVPPTEKKATIPENVEAILNSRKRLISHIPPEERRKRAAAYITKIPDSIEGQNGSRPWTQAGRLAYIDFACNEEDVDEILHEYSIERTNVPWNETERRHLLKTCRHKLLSAPETYGCKLVDATAISKAQFRLLEDLKREFPQRRPYLIDNLVRECEVWGLIAGPKVAKSWMVYYNALSVATGRPWLGRNTKQSSVLIVDLELQGQELAFRIRTVQEAMGIKDADIQGKIAVLAARHDGAMVTPFDVEEAAKQLPDVGLIFIDALYKMIPPGKSENSNGDMTELFLSFDRLASRTGASVCVIHHTSKGDQSEKATTDVGSGAGAVSRSVDTHIVLRPHDVKGLTVMDYVVRSSENGGSQTIHFDFPLWHVKDDMEPVLAVSAGRKERKQEKNDREAQAKVRTVLEQVGDVGITPGELQKQTGMGDTRVGRALLAMKERFEVESFDAPHRRHPGEVVTRYRIAQGCFEGDD